MNQINIDSLLRIGSTQKPELQLRLDPSQLYQALLKIGADDSARLQIQTPQGQLHVQIPAQVAQQVLQSTQQTLLASTAAQVSISGQPAASQTLGAAGAASPLPASQTFNAAGISNPRPASQSASAGGAASQPPAGQAPDAASTVQPASGRPLPAASPASQGGTTASLPVSDPATAVVASGSPQRPREVRLQVQLEPLASQILLTLRPVSPLVSLPLQQRQLLQLLLSSPSGPHHQLSAQSQQFSQNQKLSQQLSASTPYAANQPKEAPTGAVTSAASPAQLNWPVQLRRQSHDWQLTLPGGESLQLTAAQLPALAKVPGPLNARLVLTAQQSQLSLQLQLPQQDRRSADADPQHQPPPSMVALRPQLVAQLVPALARQQWPERLQQDLAGWLAPAKIQAPAPSATGWQWQLNMSADKAPVLELTAQTVPRQLRLDPAELSRPLQFTTPASPASVLPVADTRDLWRQLLPLSAGKPDPLADMPQLPPPVRQLLQEIRSQLPDPARQQNAQQLMQQINAALQFSPLQLPAQPNSAAGTMAIAIQLLLGRLGAQLPADRQPSPQKDKLQQLIGQLDRSQSTQLLRQLSGHSSALQSAQVANLEQQGQSAASRSNEQQLFIQLPLLQQGQSSFAELAVSEREADGSGEQHQQRCWVLTMKFDLGSMGELLVKVQLTGKEVSLQFYADQAHTVAQADQFLPLFKDRLKMQGLQLADIGCQLGKIPEHLYKQGTSLLQVRV